jgi:signal transduction histidine kinase
LAVTPIRINGLLLQGFQALGALDCSLQVLIFDTSVHNKNVSTPAFLGGAIFHQDEIIRHEETPIEFVREIPYEDAIDQTMDSRRPRRYQSIRNLKIASQEWTFIVSTTSIGQDHQSERQQLTYIAVGAVTILFSTVFLSLLIFNNARRIRTLSRVTASAAAERAAMRLESARQSAQHERELNDFIAHEVRNPLNAALSANTFVSASVNEEQPLLTEESRRSVREDVQIIDNSLLFINELLRNMLDMHRAASQQLTVQWTSVDILRDVLEPVSSMIYRRGANFDVLVDCIHPTVPSSNIIVESDPLRLKQIMLNLGRNSAK